MNTQGIWTLILFFLLCLWPSELSPNHPPTFILWNVGQGQWATLSENHRCWHFDMGGELAPWANILKECRHKQQWLSLSHWDWDHVNFVRRARMHWPQLCLKHPPLGASTAGRERTISGLPPCPSRRPPKHSAIRVTEIEWWKDSPYPLEELKANDLSRVFLIHSASGIILLTGDATAKMERVWAQELKAFDLKSPHIRYLVLGHHGSRTSTSTQLLQEVPRLQQALISARRSRYNHPHPLVTTRLAQQLIPWISTEDFGHLRLLLEQKDDIPSPNREPQARSRLLRYTH